MDIRLIAKRLALWPSIPAFWLLAYVPLWIFKDRVTAWEHCKGFTLFCWLTKADWYRYNGINRLWCFEDSPYHKSREIPGLDWYHFNRRIEHMHKTDDGHIHIMYFCPNCLERWENTTTENEQITIEAYSHTAR